jgi:glutathione S-transferase
MGSKLNSPSGELERYRQAHSPFLYSEFAKALEAFESEMDSEGPYFFGNKLGWVDILIAPCMSSSRYIYILERDANGFLSIPKGLSASGPSLSTTVNSLPRS